MLTASSDDITGTSGNDFFDAPIVQNSMIGGVSNSLSTADRIDGGAGWDILHAEIVPEFVGSTPGFFGMQMEIQPRIQNVEEIRFEAMDFGNSSYYYGEDGAVTVDAKNITDVVKIGSYYSDGDLVIENLTTKTSAGTVRNTDAITITMDHTDNYNSDYDASDLYVLFDDNYLLAGIIPETNIIQYEVMNQDAWDLINVDGQTDVELLDGVTFVRFKFNLNGVEYDLVDQGYFAVENTDLDGTAIRTHQDLAAVVEAALVDLGLDSIITVSIGQFDERDGLGNFTNVRNNVPAVVLTAEAGNTLAANENFVFLDSAEAATIPTSNRYDRADDQIIEGSDLEVTTNIELHKVGRGGEGGEVMVGAKSMDQGIPIIKVAVLGDATKPSNVQRIDTTDNALEKIYISTHADYVDGDSFASLTIREDFWSTPTLLNANAFLGDLTMGTWDRFDNIRTMTATGGGDVEYWAAVGTSDLASLGNLAFTATTAGGADTINVNVRGGAQMTVTTGAGNDTVIASVLGETNSDSTQSSITVNASSGNNTVTLSSSNIDVNKAFVTTGGGVDIVTGGGTHLTASTGAGNDVIYAENTGTKAVAVKAAYTQSTTDLVGTGGELYDVEDFMLVAGRDIRVTLAIPGSADEFVNGFETVVTVAGTKGTISTLSAYNTAVLNAINNDPVLKYLAVATVDSNNVITVRYLVDGAFGIVAPVKVEVLGLIDNGAVFTAGDALTQLQKTSLLNALKAEYSDSGITVDSLVDAFNFVDDSVAGILVAGSNSTTNGENVINAGTGDDVIVLSSNANTTDTVKFDVGTFGNDTIVHFQEYLQPLPNGIVLGDLYDVLDFTAFLNLNYSFSGSVGTVSQRRVETTLEFDDTIDGMSAAAGRNIVSVIDFDDLTVPAALTVTTFAQLLALSSTNMALLMNATFDTTAAVAHATKHIILIENVFDTNVETANLGNLGEYAVIQAETSATSDVFTNVQLIGTLDFGDTQLFGLANFA